MDWLTFDSAANAASFAGFGATLLQWFALSAKEDAAQTLDHYLEWLRRTGHAELAARLAENVEMLGQVADAIEEVKRSVIKSVIEHEANSQARHDQIKSLILATKMLERPRLQIRIDRNVHQMFTHFPKAVAKSLESDLRR